MLLYGALHALFWVTGVRQYELAVAVDRGAARVERRLMGEETADVIRRQIQLQRDTLPFWTAVAWLSDFVFGPLLLAGRALSVAVAFSAAAALAGRRVRFPVTMADCVRWQAVWILGVAVQAALMLLLRRGDVDTSLVALLPSHTYHATTWVWLRQLDLFAILGWLGMAYSGWYRRQANVLVACCLCGALAVLEAAIRAYAELGVQLSMRLTLFPQ
jgi:hypothetical protein